MKETIVHILTENMMSSKSLSNKSAVTSRGRHCLMLQPQYCASGVQGTFSSYYMTVKGIDVKTYQNETNWCQNFLKGL